MLKKPIKGGTPAIENNKIVSTNRWKLLKWKLLNECKVLKVVNIVVKKVQNSSINDKLYRNMYENIRILLSQVKLKNNIYMKINKSLK